MPVDWQEYEPVTTDKPAGDTDWTQFEPVQPKLKPTPENLKRSLQATLAPTKIVKGIIDNPAAALASEIGQEQGPAVRLQQAVSGIGASTLPANIVGRIISNPAAAEASEAGRRQSAAERLRQAAFASGGNISPMAESSPALTAISAPLINLARDPKSMVEAARQFTASALKTHPDNVGTELTQDQVDKVLKHSNAASVMVGMGQSLGDLDSFFTSPIGIATLGIGGLPTAVQRMISLAFAAQMASSVPETARQLGEELGKPEDQRDKTKIARLVSNAVTTAGFTPMAGLHGLGERVPIMRRPPQEDFIDVEATQVEAPKQLTAGESLTQPKNRPMVPKPPKPVVPGTEDISQILPEIISGSAPTAPKAELATWDDFVQDLRKRGSPSMTKNQIIALYPQQRLSREVAAQLAHDAFGAQPQPPGQPTGEPDAGTVRTDQGQLRQEGLPAETGQVDSGSDLQQATPGAPAAPGTLQQQPQANVPAQAPPVVAPPAAAPPAAPTYDIEDLLKRPAGEIDPPTMHSLSDVDAARLFRANGDRKTATQHDGVLAGMKLTPADVPELQRMAEIAGRKAMEALQAKNDEAFFGNYGKQLWFTGAIEGANRKGPNHDAVVKGQTPPGAEPPGLTPPPAGPISPPPGPALPPAPAPPAAPAAQPPAAQPPDLGAPTPTDVGENTQVTPAMRAADLLVPHIQSGKLITKAQVHDIMAATHGGTLAEGKFTSKDQSDVLEMAVNIWINRHAQAFDPGAETSDQAHVAVQNLKLLLARLPTQTTRTPETDRMQQFSTPPTEAFVANWVARPGPDDVVLEPSAGLAGLAVFSKNAGAKVITNELSPRRRAMLEQMGLADHVTGHNAELLHALMTPAINSRQIPRPTLAVMNPPFSVSAMTNDKRTMIGAGHVEQALRLLPPGGRLVAIVGEGMAMHRPHFVAWWRKISGQYNVRANITVSGEEYRKYGTTWDNQLVVIDNTGKTPDLGKVVTGRAEKVEDLIPMLEAIRNDRPSPQQPPAQPSGSPPAGQGPTPPVPTGQGNVPPATRPGGPGGSGRPTLPGTRPPPQAPGGLQPIPAPPAVSPPGATGPVPAPGPTIPAPAPTGGSDIQPTPGGVPAVPGLDVGQKSSGQRQLSETGVFSEYSPQKVNVKGAPPHPTPLVESTSMASVEPVDPKYKPAISTKTIEAGGLSNPQLEQIIYAGQAHQNMLPTGERQGYFIGDGTGVGKGREIAGIFLDNSNQGRKKGLWLSAARGLYKDAQRDFGDVGMDPTKLINIMPKGGNALIGQKEGIAFCTYTSLTSKHDGLDLHAPEGEPRLLPPGDPQKPSRMHRLVDYFGKDFDGVIVFDESHLAGNAMDLRGSRGVKEASARGKMVLDVQTLFPNARVVYVSATGATDVTNLSYADRLGIWGPGTPFPAKQQFFNAIEAGGLSAMEVVARDLKATGKYLARTLSFAGVENSPLEHQLTPDQVTLYNDLSRAWQLVMDTRDQTMARTGMANNGRARGAANSRFYGAQQRFYNQLLTAMQSPSVIAAIKKSLDAGHSPLVALVNTNEATLNREIAKKSAEADEGDSDWVEDLDLSPKDILLEYVDAHYPTQLYRPVTDDHGNTRWQPVIDEQNNPVDDPQALEEKQRLMDHIKLIKAPKNPLEMILDTFGSENVAEITGRSRRVVQKLQPDGTRKAAVENRTAAHREIEAKEFLDDKRRILIRSAAGGTGFSFQAGRKYKNQRQRDDILAQAGWRADLCIQQLGRTHRSDQVSAPHYFLASTNLKGHRRFISTVMRRLGELGSMTSGERRATGRELFNENDDLENAYAEAAVLQFFRAVHNGEVPSISFDDLSRKLGFTRSFLNANTGEIERINTLIDKDSGALNLDKIPEIHTFLNRILMLEVAEQNHAFDQFDEIRRTIIDNAKADGTYDPGTQTVRALAIRKVKDETVYRDPNSTAVTRLVEIDSDHAVKLTPWEQRGHIASDRRIVEYVQNIKSGHVFALKEGPDKTLDNGSVVPTWRRLHPTGHDIVQRSTVNTERAYGLDPNYRSVSESEAERLWNEQVAKAPKTKTHRDTYVVGTLLPIWDRLQIPRPRMWRMTTDKGENLLGVQVPPAAVADLRDRLGAGGGEQPTPKMVFDRVLDRNVPVELANGWTIKRSRVQGDVRIEVRGVQESQMQEFERFIGGFIERINYEPRFFIPTDEDRAIPALTKLLNKSPVITKRPGSGTPPATGYFDRSSEASGLGRISGAPTLEDIRAQRAADLNRGIVADPLTGVQLRYSGVPLPTTMAEFRDFLQGLQTAGAEARHFWRGFSMRQLPRITDADRESGEAGARYAQAPYVAREHGLIFAGKVLEGISDPNIDQKLGNAIAEDNLRDIKQRWIDRADEVAHKDELIAMAQEEMANWAEEAQAGDAEARSIMKDLRTQIARLQELEPEDERRFRALEAGVFSFIGKPGAAFATEDEYQRFLSDPLTNGILERHRNLWREQKDPLFRVANDLDPDVPLQTRGLQTQARINLKAITADDPNSPTTVGKRPARSTLTKQTATLKRKDPFALRAEGQGEAYEGSYTELIANGFERELPISAQHDFLNAMIRGGIAGVSDREFIEDEIHGEKTKGYLLKLRPWRGRFLQLPKSLAPEYESVSGLKPSARIPYYTKFGEFLTKQSIIGFAEGSTHMTNLLSEVFTGVGPTANPLINTLIKSIGRADLLYRLPAVLINGMRDSREEMLELATIGGAKQPYGGPVMGRFLNLIDRGVRLSNNHIFNRMAAAGWVENTETNRREYLNQVGSYNKRLQPYWIQWLRDTHIQPFATAMQTFNIMGLRRLGGAPGVKATSKAAAAALRFDIAAGAMGFLALIAFLNYLVSGNAEGPKGTKIGSVGWIGEDGKLHQFDLGLLTGWTRGARVTGLQSFVESRRQGLSPNSAMMAAVKSAGNTAVSSVAGPGVQFLTKAMTGSRPGVPMTQEAPVVPPQDEFAPMKSQLASNIRTAIRQANPLVDSTIGIVEGRPANEIAQRQFSRYAPRTGLPTETIQNLPRIVKKGEVNAYADALAKQARQIPKAQRAAWIIDALRHDQLAPDVRAMALIELRRKGAFTYP